MAKKNTRAMAWNEKEAREALTRYEGLVRLMARRLKPAASVGQALDEDDLCAEGRVAVLEALTSYEGYGIKEQTWVRTRIRQRMIDAVRRLDLRSRDEIRLAVRHAAGETHGTSEEQRGRMVCGVPRVSGQQLRPLRVRGQDALRRRRLAAHDPQQGHRWPCGSQTVLQRVRRRR